jgi:hypothetical protein
MKLKHIFSLAILALSIAASQVRADIIFSENVGTVVTGTLSYANNPWQNAGLSFTGSGDTRSTGASSGYTGASGERNVFLTNNGTSTLIISQINTLNYVPGTFDLSFGAFKSTTASDMTELQLEYSDDGVNFTSIAIPAQPTGGGTANWRLISFTGLSLPTVSDLRLRWTNTASGSGTPQFRLDDITLQAVNAIPEPSSILVLLGFVGMVAVRRKRI